MAVAVLVALGAGAAAWRAGWHDGAGAMADREAAAAAAPSRIACTPSTVGARPDAPEGMVWVPGGRLVPGDDVYPEEAGGRPVTVAGFWMDRTEVTNDQFGRFVASTGYVTVAERMPDGRGMTGAPADLMQPGAAVFIVPRKLQGPPDPLQWWRYVPGANWRHPGGPGTSIEGRGSLPVVAIALEDVQAYARWAGRQLPTEAQWEWAAREAVEPRVPSPAGAGGRTDGHERHEQPSQANTWQGRFPMADAASDGFAGVAPVGCYAPNALGLHDMIGNVWEWTRDTWRPRHGDTPAPVLQAERAAAGGGPAAQGVIKGGSFLCSPDFCMRYRAGARQPQDIDLATSHLGFRTVLEAKAAPR